MPQQRLYYEYIDDQLVPYWYVLTFEPCELDWDKPMHYFKAFKPFEFVERDGFDDSQVGISIYLADLVFNKFSPEKVGINLTAVKRRINQHGVDPYMIQQFIISLPELDDLLGLLPIERKLNLVLNR